MNASTKKSAVVAAGMAVCLASNVGVAVATEAPAPNVEKPEAAQEAQAAVATSDIQSEEQVEGTFAFDQTTITPNEHIAKFFRVPSDVVCREGVPYEGLGADFRIAVGGDVAQPFAASLEEMSREVGSHRQIMGCSCAGNLPDGGAFVNASVTGVLVADLWAQSEPEAGINTVTFTCADGTQEALPLTYLVQHNAVIVSQINGEDLSESVGGTNQLWIASSSARYYYRDIVAIDFTREAEAPASPTFEPTRDAYVNQPSIALR